MVTGTFHAGGAHDGRGAPVPTDEPRELFRGGLRREVPEWGELSVPRLHTCLAGRLGRRWSSRGCPRPKALEVSCSPCPLPCPAHGPPPALGRAVAGPGALRGQAGWCSHLGWLGKASPWCGFDIPHANCRKSAGLFRGIGGALRAWERSGSMEPAWPVQRGTEQETKSVTERCHNSK